MTSAPGLPILFASQTLLACGMGLSFPFFAIYLTRERGIPMGVVGTMLALTILGTSVSQGFGGELSDILGRKRVMRLAMVWRSATVLLLAAAMWLGWPFAILAGVHVLSNFVGHFFDPAARGWIADHCPAEQRSEAYGLLRIATNAGWAIGPAVGGFLAHRSYPALFAATALACGLCAALISWRIEDAPGGRARDGFEFRSVLRAAEDRRFLRFCLCNLLIAVVMAQIAMSLAVHATRYAGLSESQVGLLFSLNGVIVVLLQYPLGRWWSGSRITSALAFGSLLYAAGYMAIGFSASMAAMAGAMVIISLGEIIVSPGLQALAANMAPAALKGRYLGFLGLSHQTGAALGPLLGGLGLQYLSPRSVAAPWVALAAVGVAAAAGFRSIARLLRPHEEGLVPEETT